MALKAAALGVGKLAWYDLLAPLGESSRRYAWPEAEDVIRTNFRAFSDRMADFAETTFREKWIDAEPRFGKEGGAYCTGTRPGESRVFMNFDGSANGVSTLAHELGHAYHNLKLARPFALAAFHSHDVSGDSQPILRNAGFGSGNGGKPNRRNA